MNTKLAQLAAALLLSISLIPSAFASGSYGGGSSYNSGRIQQKQVDQVYETGKAIFLGRQRGVEKLSYCVKVDGELAPVKRRSVKAFKNTSYNELAQNMFNCDQPETKITNQLSRDNFLYVVYYLNKRHKLNLKSS